MLLSLHPNILVRVENVVSLFSSPSTSSQKHKSVAAINFILRPYSVASWSLLPELPKFAEMLLEYDVASNIIVHVENVVSLFSSPSTSSQKVQKCGSHIRDSRQFPTRCDRTEDRSMTSR